MKGRGLPWLLVPVSLLPGLGAALARETYYFRDFSVTFYPLRLFAARELQAGRWPSWNPYVYEGAFALPVLYPLDLLHALWPGPVAVSWLLTLHLPLAALAAYALARGLGVGTLGAFVSGACYALGGLALSSLNLYVFLQALALAPLVVLGFMRAAERGGRSIVVAGVVLALGLSTLAVEFVAQAVLLGLAVGLAPAPRHAPAARALLGLALGVALAAVPLFVTTGLLAETARGAGFPAEVGLGNEVHPLGLLQMLVPEMFGVLSAPVESWWGGRFFTKGFPYFLSLYVGPIVLALAVTGAPALERRRQVVLLAAAGLGVWYALGARAGLATLVASVPALRVFRFPSKAMLLPYLVLALLAGLGAGRLSRGEGWRTFAAAAAAGAGLALAVATIVLVWPTGVADWAQLERAAFPAIGWAVGLSATGVAVVALVGAGLALAVARGLVAPRRAAALLAGVVALDLARAGAGLNPQAPPAFFEPLPELAGARLDELDGGRVFSYGPDRSEAFQGFLKAGGPRLGLASFFINRQLLGPYNNILDRVETPEAKDLTAFVPRPPELGPEDYDHRAFDRLLPWLRNASVSRVVSLDPLDHPDLTLQAVVPLGRAGLSIQIYELSNPWPRAYLACRASLARSAEQALAAPYAPGFDPGRDVALEVAAAVSCREGGARRLSAVPGETRYEVVSDGDGFLVARDSFARGWAATVDGQGAPVLRANGKHQAVPVPGGRHQVTLRYRPPGLLAGLWTTGLGLLAALALWARPVLGAGTDRA